VQSLWYKTDPFILSSQAKKIFYIQDTSLGKDWRVVQKFEHRNIYDVAEKDEGNHDVHQDDYHSDTDHVVQEDGEDVPLPNIQGGEATIIQGSAHHHAMGSEGEPLGPRVPLLVARTLRLLPVLHCLRHLPIAGDCGGARGRGGGGARGRYGGGGRGSGEDEEA
jgi:hypothetical protein